MELSRLLAVLILSSTLLCLSESYDPLTPCPEEQKVCEYTLRIEHKLTMMYNNEQRVHPCNGRLCFKNGTQLSGKKFLTA